jgi:GxxExxY protein
VVTDVQIVRQVGRPPLALQPQGFSCRVQAYFEQKDTKATKFKNREQKGVLIFSFSVFAPRFSAFGNRILRFLCFLLFQDETNTMHPLFTKADKLSGEIIGAAIEVHRIMGPGLLESIYERCLLRELELRGVPVLNQEEVVIDYKGTVFKEVLKFDLLADGCLLVELKATRDVLPIHKAQLLSYMKLLDVPLGLVFNFHEVKLIDGISRLVLPGANKP